jgi:hypothetical protein
MTASDPSRSPVAVTFVVRLWPEWLGERGGASEWRGEVARVGSERKVYFRTLAGLEDAFRRIMETEA